MTDQRDDSGDGRQDSRFTGAEPLEQPRSDQKKHNDFRRDRFRHRTLMTDGSSPASTPANHSERVIHRVTSID